MKPAKIIVLDTETTGIDVEKDHVVEIAIKFGLEPGADATVWRVKPPVIMRPEIIEIHKITNEELAQCPTYGEIADDVSEAIENAEVLVGYNPDFDVAMLNREAHIAGRPIRWPKTIICAKRLWDINEPPPPRHLIAAFKHFVDAEGYTGAHGALADINATARVVQAQLQKFSLEGRDWSELDPERATWVGPSAHLKWRDETKDCIMVHFGKYNGRDIVEMDDWYTNMITQKDFPVHLKEICNRLKLIRKQRIPMPSKAIALWAKEHFS